MKKRIATIALLAGLIAAPGFVADAHAGRHCDRRSDARYDRYDRYDRYNRYDSGYDDYRYERVEPRYRYTRVYDDYAPRRGFAIPFPPAVFSFFFSR